MYTRKPIHVWLFLGAMTLSFLVVGLLDVTFSEQKPMIAEPSLTAQAPLEPPVLATSPLGNQFRNPDFEEGKEPWFSMETWKTNFSLSTQIRHSGTQSAVLVLDSRQAGSPRGSRVYGVVQEIRPAQFPEKISGHYYVEHWQQGTPLQYIQFVVGVLGAKNIPPSVGQVNNYQIRYVLAGVDQPPVPMSNVKYILLGTHQPDVGKWMYFERNLAEDFQAAWGDVPQAYDSLRIFFEARWDGRKESDGLSSAQVFFDDLFVGEKLK